MSWSRSNAISASRTEFARQALKRGKSRSKPTPKSPASPRRNARAKSHTAVRRAKRVRSRIASRAPIKAIGLHAATTRVPSGARRTHAPSAGVRNGARRMRVRIVLVRSGVHRINTPIAGVRNGARRMRAPIAGVPSGAHRINTPIAGVRNGARRMRARIARVRSASQRGTHLRVLPPVREARESAHAVGESLRAVAEHDADLGAFEHFLDVAFAELRVQDQITFAKGLVHRVTGEGIHGLTERLRRPAIGALLLGARLLCHARCSR